MKTLLLLFALVASGSCFAQTAADENTTIPKRYDPKQKWDGTTPTTYTTSDKKALAVPQSTGKTYGEELNNMARRDVNGIASTVGGVDSRPGTGETPSIRGAGASGTAYFVDGVRVYGALPIITK